MKKKSIKEIKKIEELKDSDNNPILHLEVRLKREREDISLDIPALEYLKLKEFLYLPIFSAKLPEIQI